MAKIIDPLLAINFDPPSRVISCQISVLVDNFLLPALKICEWHASIGDATLVDAILDRLMHNSLRIELKS